MKNKKVKQMICDVMEAANPTYEENPVYRHRFGRYWCLDDSDVFRIQPYQLCNDGMKVSQGVVSLTADQLRGK